MILEVFSTQNDSMILMFYFFDIPHLPWALRLVFLFFFLFEWLNLEMELIFCIIKWSYLL